MATIDKDGWGLESAEERHRAEPEKFQIPSFAERNGVEVGSRVKLLVLLLGRDDSGPFIQCERLWVTVEEASAPGYIGRLESLPVTSDVLQPGAMIAFGPHHIAAVLVRTTDPRHPDYVQPN